MAVYVTSDAHGHVGALDEALGAASPAAEDELYVLGDMIDRGPDPLGVVSLVRSRPNTHVLMGNHEELMLAALLSSGAPKNGSFDVESLDMEGMVDWTNWMSNGGGATARQLAELDADAYADFLSWARELPLFATVVAGGRTYALVHAGIDPARAAEWRALHPEADLEDPATLDELLAAQPPEDLLWVREGFWGQPTGLIDAKGRGPVVIAGHTPSPYLRLYASNKAVAFTSGDGHGTVVRLGACDATGNVPDRVDIDCAAAGGFGVGRVGVMRLDDGATWFAAVREGE